MFIKITEKEMEYENLNFEGALQLCCSALLQLARAIVKEHPEPEHVENLYNTMNEAFGQTLHLFAPELEPNPDLDVDTVIALQDTYINDELSKLKAQNPRLYKRKIKEYKKLHDKLRAQTMEHKATPITDHPRFQEVPEVRIEDEEG